MEQALGGGERGAGLPRTGEPSAREAWGYAWACVKKDFVGVVAPPAIALALAAAVNVALSLGVGAVATGVIAKESGLMAALSWSAFVRALVAVPAAVVAAFVLAGITRFASRLVRGGKPGFADVFSGTYVFGPGLVAAAVTLLAPAVVSALFRYVPVLAWLGFLASLAGGIVSPWALAAVEQGASGFAAVRSGAAQVSAGPATALLLFIFGGLGVLACCIGMFVTLPMLFVAVAYVCRRRAGEPVSPVS